MGQTGCSFPLAIRSILQYSIINVFISILNWGWFNVYANHTIQYPLHAIILELMGHPKQEDFHYQKIKQNSYLVIPSSDRQELENMNNKRSRYIFIPTLILPLALLGLLLAGMGSNAVARGDVQTLEQTKTQPAVMKDGRVEYAAGRVVVKFRSTFNVATERGQLNTGLPQVDSLLAVQGVSSMRSLFYPQGMQQGIQNAELAHIYLLELETRQDVLDAVKAFQNSPEVEWAEPDYIARCASENSTQLRTTTPNDPLLPSQWGLSKIHAPDAWDVVTGTSTVVIAVLDSGIDKTHPDLSGKLWVNPGEIPGNGIDDDNNGYIDDVNGWNFVNNNNDPSDDNGHGTQVAGIAAAATNNGLGIAGMCWNCKIMPVKVMQSSGIANYSDITTGVWYAAQKGAEVINLSLGGYGNSSALHAAIQEAVNTYGAVVVGGAGNDNLNAAFYPAAYDEVLAVAGTTATDEKATLSNYGTWVDVSAPAINITTTFLGGDWGPVNGTSFAAPFVSGLAGLLHSQHLE